MRALKSSMDQSIHCPTGSKLGSIARAPNCGCGFAGCATALAVIPAALPEKGSSAHAGAASANNRPSVAHPATADPKPRPLVQLSARILGVTATLPPRPEYGGTLMSALMA